jgi:transcription-repair coupling factor (superfamily II helicase)
MSLASLPRLLRNEPALTQALGDPSGFVAVPESARALALAALAQLGGKRPLVVACPTGTDAGQLYDDLVQYMPEGEVVLFPAWETLPFERVSPSIETMGHRLRTCGACARRPTDCPAIVVARVRALLQQLGPDATTVEPIHVTARARCSTPTL